MESNRKSELQKYKEAKIMFNTVLVMSKCSLNNGSIDINQYKEAIENEYKRKIVYIQNKIEERPDLAKAYEERLKDLGEYFKLVIDINKVYLLEAELKEEKNANRKKEDFSNKLEKVKEEYEEKILGAKKAASSIKNLAYKQISNDRKPRRLEFSVLEQNGYKNVTVMPKGTIHFCTSFNFYSDINVYEVTKNIQGIDTTFEVKSNSNYMKIQALLNKKRIGEELSRDESEYLGLFAIQFSDYWLKTCRDNLGGYIGNIEQRNGKSSISFDEDDCGASIAYANRKEKIEHNNTNKIEKNYDRAE